jgi:integrase
VPRIKLTKKTLERLKAPHPSGRQTLYWDSELKGFGILVSGVTNARTFVVQHALNGKTRRVTIGPANVLALDEGRRRAEGVLADFYRGIDPKHGRRGATTLRGALDAYIAARPTLKPNSIRDLRGAVERCLKEWLDRPLREITGEMVEARHRSIRSEVAARGRYKGEAIANGAMQALGTLWTFAAEREPMPGRNPVGRLKRQWFKIHRRERLVSDDELPAFYEAVQALSSPVARDYLLLLLFTGLRRSEAAGLTWDDIDFKSKLIRIPAERTKAGRRLDLPMTDVVRDLLVARRAIGRERFIFPSSIGKSGHLVEPKFPLRQIAAATGIRISAHDLRRTFVTAAYRCNISPLALKCLVNHAVGDDVTSGYIQISTEDLREPAQKVADRLKALCGIVPPEGAATMPQSSAPAPRRKVPQESGTGI